MTLTPATAERLQQGFKQMNKLIVMMWRLGLGAWINIWPEVGGRILVITHTGRKTGLRRRTPVNYAIVNGEIYCMAGFGAVSDWYRNLKAHPGAEIWLPDGWWQVTAEEVEDPETRLPIIRQVIIGSGFAARLFGINIDTISDDELAKITLDYCLLHLRRVAPLTGPGGPGDLAWVWPLATLVLLPLALLRHRRRCE